MSVSFSVCSDVRLSGIKSLSMIVLYVGVRARLWKCHNIIYIYVMFKHPNHSDVAT